jgi:hypothetical protein
VMIMMVMTNSWTKVRSFHGSEHFQFAKTRSCFNDRTGITFATLI